MQELSPDPVARPTQRPKPLRLGIFALAAAVALGIPRSALEWPALMEQAAMVGSGPGFIIGTQVFSFVVVGGLLLLTWMGKNWARWIYVVLTALGIPFSIKPLVFALSSNPASGILGLVQVALQIFGLACFFHPATRAWFTRPKPEVSANTSAP